MAQAGRARAELGRSQLSRRAEPLRLALAPTRGSGACPLQAVGPRRESSAGAATAARAGRLDPYKSHQAPAAPMASATAMGPPWFAGAGLLPSSVRHGDRQPAGAPGGTGAPASSQA